MKQPSGKAVTFTVYVNEEVEDDPGFLLSQIDGKEATVDVEGYRFFGVVDLKEGLEREETCPVCGQPDNCGDCDHTPVAGWKWFVNEEGVPYQYDVARQAVVYPNDDHTPFDTREQALAADVWGANDATSVARIQYLRHRNHRLQKFLSRADFHGWRIEGSIAAEDCIVVRHPTRDDHFVLYPTGLGIHSSLTVYDGRDGREFSPLPARAALSHIAHWRTSDETTE